MQRVSSINKFLSFAEKNNPNLITKKTSLELLALYWRRDMAATQKDKITETSCKFLKWRNIFWLIGK